MPLSTGKTFKSAKFEKLPLTQALVDFSNAMPSDKEPAGTHPVKEPDAREPIPEKSEPPDSSYEVFDDAYNDP